MTSNLLQKHTYYNNKFFARWARLYDYEKYFLFPLRRKAAKFLGLSYPKKVIDIATGTGSQAFELAKLGYDVIGVDLSKEMLEQSQKKVGANLRLRFQQADSTDLPFKDNSFDAASISLGLHDMPYEIDLLTLKETKRVTKNGGTILIVDYMEPKKHLVAKILYPIIRAYETPNYIPFIQKGLDEVLETVGLKVIKDTNFLGLFQIVLVKNEK